MSTAAEIAAAAKRAERLGAPSPSLFSIAGNIVDDGDEALEGVVVTAKLNGFTLASATTDASGDYAFAAGFPANGYYDLYAPLTGYTPDASPLVVTVAVADVTDADFVLTED